MCCLQVLLLFMCSCIVLSKPGKPCYYCFKIFYWKQFTEYRKQLFLNFSKSERTKKTVYRSTHFIMYKYTVIFVGFLCWKKMNTREVYLHAWTYLRVNMAVQAGKQVTHCSISHFCFQDSSQMFPISFGQQTQTTYNTWTTRKNGFMIMNPQTYTLSSTATHCTSIWVVRMTMRGPTFFLVTIRPTQFHFWGRLTLEIHRGHSLTSARPLGWDM